jgi:small subunit ribosomal protein S18
MATTIQKDEGKDEDKFPQYIDYKNIPFLLRKYVTYFGKLKPRRYTGASISQQKKIARAVKRARVMGLMFFVRGQ